MAGRAATGALLIAAGLALAGCAEGERPLGFLGGGGGAGGDGSTAAATRIVERDVEAPQVFQVSEAGLWDGRPSLGGVWVAYPGIDDPERVIIRNPTNERFVIGALFRRERENPGPRLQVSSDAAEALGMLAGQPVTLQVTALRREEVPEPQPEAAAALDTAETVEAETLEPLPESTAGTIPGARATPRPATEASSVTAPSAAAPDATAAAPRATAPARPAAAATGGRTLLQIGIFSVEANANRAAAQMREIGAIPAVRRETSQGKTFWRVVVGPVATPSERTALLARVKALGYADAFYTGR